MWTTRVRWRLGPDNRLRLMRAAYRVVYTARAADDTTHMDEGTEAAATRYSIAQPCVRRVGQLAPPEADRMAQYYDFVQLGAESLPSPHVLATMSRLTSAALFGSRTADVTSGKKKKENTGDGPVRVAEAAAQAPYFCSEAAMMNVVVLPPAGSPSLGWFGNDDGEEDSSDVCAAELQNCCAALDELSQRGPHMLQLLGSQLMSTIQRKYITRKAHNSIYVTASHVSLAEMRFGVERVVRHMRLGLARTGHSREHVLIQLALSLLTPQMPRPAMAALTEQLLLLPHTAAAAAVVVVIEGVPGRRELGVGERRTVEAVMRAVLCFAQSRSVVYDLAVLRKWLERQPADALPRPLRTSFAALLAPHSTAARTHNDEEEAEAKEADEGVMMCPVHPFAALVMRWWWPWSSADRQACSSSSSAAAAQGVARQKETPSLQTLVDAAVRLTAELRETEQSMLRSLGRTPTDAAQEQTSEPPGQAARFERDILREYVFSHCVPGIRCSAATAAAASAASHPRTQPLNKNNTITTTSSSHLCTNKSEKEEAWSSLWLPGAGLDAQGYWTDLLKACDLLCAALAVGEEPPPRSSSAARAQRVAHALRHQLRVHLLRRVYCTSQLLLSPMMQQRVAPFLICLCTSLRPHRQLFALLFGPSAAAAHGRSSALHHRRQEMLALVTLEPSLTPCELYCGTRGGLEHWAAPCEVPRPRHAELGGAIAPPCTLSTPQLTQLRRCVRTARAGPLGDGVVCVYMLCEGSACLSIASSITDIPLRALLT